MKGTSVPAKRPRARLQRRALLVVTVLIFSLLQMTTLVSSSATAFEDTKVPSPLDVVTTTLSAAGVTPGAKITVLTGTAVTDQATLTGVKAHADSK